MSVVKKYPIPKGTVCPDPACRGKRIWNKGLTPSRRGLKSRYICFDCGRTFYKPSDYKEIKPAPKPKRVKKVKDKSQNPAG